MLIGVNPDGNTPGRGEVDEIWGNRGTDTFVIGDEDSVYYDDGQTNTTGADDLVVIYDFEPNRDRIQLHGDADDYQLQLTENQQHTQIFYTANQNQPELIGQVQNRTELVLDNSQQFQFLGMSSEDENIMGTNQNDTLIGNEGNDQLTGRQGNDLLIGVNPDGNTPGRGEVDEIWGNRGTDTFVLGDEDKVYYDDGQTNTTGADDLVVIYDFESSRDRIRLSGSADDYELQLTENQQHTQIFYTANQNQPELIGQVQNRTELVLDSEQFNFI